MIWKPTHTNNDETWNLLPDAGTSIHNRLAIVFPSRNFPGQWCGRLSAIRFFTSQRVHYKSTLEEIKLHIEALVALEGFI